MNTPWMIVAGDLSPLGGMDRANHALARHLASSGHDVHLVTHHAWPDLERLPGVMVQRVWRPLDRHVLGSPFLSYQGQRSWRQLQALGVRAIVNGGNCPVAAANWVHYVHGAHKPVIAGSAVHLVKATCLHRHDVRAERVALSKASVVICNSERTRRDVLEHAGVHESRTHVVYYGSDTVPFASVTATAHVLARRILGCSPSRPLAGFVGALGDRRKGFDRLFAAWKTLCEDTRWDADLVVIGDGVELNSWRERVIAAGMGERVRFLGFCRDVSQVLSALDVLVHPARYEAYGLAVQEALCQGVPAIVSRSSGVVERYPDDMFDLVIDDPEDCNELVCRLLWWRQRLEEWRERVRPLSERLRRRTWDDMAREIVALVERAA